MLPTIHYFDGLVLRPKDFKEPQLVFGRLPATCVFTGLSEKVHRTLRKLKTKIHKQTNRT